MPTTPPMVNLDNLSLENYGAGGAYVASLGRIGSLLGTRQIGCTLVELEPGKMAWPYHLHYGQEELFIILSGEGTVRFDGETRPLKSGDVVFTPPGPGTAHQITNNSSEKLRYLALSSKEDPEVCYYPDSDKYGAYAGEDGQHVFELVVPGSAKVDYWDGES